MSAPDLRAQLASQHPTFDFERFQNPHAIDRPVPFFSWNERMEPAELRRQVDLIAEGGWGGAFVHSRIGLTTPYLGEEWFRAVDATIDQCSKRGLKVWLYDEDKWPSGFSGGSVPLADKSFRMQALIARPESLPAPPDCEPVGEPQAGLQMYCWTAPLGHDWFNGTCYAGLMNREAMKKFLGDAYESYYSRYAEDYGDVIVGEFTDEPCSLTRFRIPQGSVPYTPELLGLFEKMHGYNPCDKLHLLYADGEEAASFRVQYFRTANALFEGNFSKQLGDWCREHSIVLTGHYMLEDSVYGQQLWGVKIMPNYRHEGIPGIDHLCRHVGATITPKQCQSVVNQYNKPRMLSEIYGVDGGSLSFEDRAWIAAQQMCLGVNLLNPHLSLYTMTGCRKRDYPQNIYYQQPFWPVNRVLDDQLSRTCVALSQGRYHAEALVIHPCESAFALWHTELRPEGFEGLLDSDWNPLVKESKEKIDQIDKDLVGLMDALFAAQRTFDFGDETILADDARVALVGDKAFIRINDMDYPAVILPSMVTIAESTVNLLKGFMAAGGQVLRCGEAPTLIDGAADVRLAKFLWKIPKVEQSEVADVLATIVPPAILVHGVAPEDRQKLYAHVRDLPDGSRICYLVNLNRIREFQGEFTFTGFFREALWLDPATGQPHVLEAVLTGTGEQAEEGIAVEMTFAPAQTRLLLLSSKRKEARGVSLVPAAVREEQVLPASQWHVTRLDDNALTLDYARWKADGEWSVRPAPVIGIQEYLNSAKYDGSLTLRYPVCMQGLSSKRRLHLVVEYPERYMISVNGRPVQYAGLPQWRDFRWLPIDITGLLKEGDNVIELRCDHFQHGDLTVIDEPFRRYGTEIESIYLVGDFSVVAKPLPEKPVAGHWADFGLPPIDVQCFKYESFMVVEPRPLVYGDVTVQGLPFYAGRLRLETTLAELPPAGRWFVQAEKLDCPIAEVALDDQTIGYLMSHPLEVDMSKTALAEGQKLSITLYGTLRNLMGPHHHPEGESGVVGPNSFSAEAVLDDKRRNIWVHEHQMGKPVSGYVDRYCMVSFGNPGDIKLIAREERTLLR